MATFRFFGRVLPKSSNMTLTGFVIKHWDDPSIGLSMDARLIIKDSVVEVFCDSNLSGNDNYDGHVHFHAMDLARSVVNGFAYARGLGFAIILDSVIKPDGIEYDINDQRPDLAELVTAFRTGSQQGSVDLSGMLEIILTEPLIFLSLNDLVSSIAAPQHAPVNCGRVVEAIRELMSPGDRKGGWAVMRERLNLTQQYLTFITDQSKGPRHGDPRGLRFADIQETIRRSAGEFAVL